MNKDSSRATSLKLLSRRNLLKSAAVMALVGPVLARREALGAGGATSPRRLILVYSPNGPITAIGPASGTETNFTLHDWWSPLERHRADAIFVSHLSSTGAGQVYGSGHGLGGQSFSGAGSLDDAYNAAGETIDQTIARRLEAENRAGLARSVAWGLEYGNWNAFWSEAGRTISPELNPSNAWAQLFANFMAPSATPEDQARAAAAIARQKSVLDFVDTDCVALRDALGAEGMRLLDEHCTTVRSMEKNLTATLAPSCTKPNDPSTRDWQNPENIDDHVAAFIDLMATALACELTHVIGFQFGPEAARLQLASSYGVPSSPLADSNDSGPAHHPWTHQPVSQLMNDAMRIFTQFYSSKVALLIDKLKSTNDASGRPLLDSTAVLWVSELGGSDGGVDGAHVTGNVPAVLFGNGQGTFRTGRYIHGSSTGGDPGSVEGGREMAQLMVSMLHYMGLNDLDTVGGANANGPFTALY